jgi:hypothetical protein
MSQRMRGVIKTLGFYALWLLLAALLVLAAYQVYSTLIFLGILLIENPATRPAGWNTGTMTALSRFLILVLGGTWLVAVSFLEGYLRDASEQRQLRDRVIRLLLIIGGIFGISYVVLLLLSLRY